MDKYEYEQATRLGSLASMAMDRQQSAHGAGMVDQISAQTPQPPVSIQLDRLASLIGVAHTELEQLTKRLDPALDPKANPEKTPQPEQIASCQLERRVIDAVEQVTELVRRMRMVQDALCI
jgi:hypothetical protein